MKITGIAIMPPESAIGNPKVTPELLASVLARYSHSNKGIDSILSKIDPDNPEASINKSTRSREHRHAPVSGLTGGIAITMDGISMWLACKVFELAQMADGRESSTRCIPMTAANLPNPDDIGIPDDLAKPWRETMIAAYAAYHAETARLEASIKKQASTPKNRQRFALDRARYLIPFATKTNMALVQTARMWAQLIQQLKSMPQREARTLGQLLTVEALRFTPRFILHADAEAGTRKVFESELEMACRQHEETNHEPLPDQTWVSVHHATAPFMPQITPEEITAAVTKRQNPCSMQGHATRRTRVTFAFNNIALAELRDLNRHRTGHRFSILTQKGIYLPPETLREKHCKILKIQTNITRELMRRRSPAYLYSMLLGAQTPWEHTCLADKFIHEVEMRTGTGTHFRYAEHMRNAAHLFQEQTSTNIWRFKTKNPPGTTDKPPQHSPTDNRPQPGIQTETDPAPEPGGKPLQV
jgi:hypothetical protein